MTTVKFTLSQIAQKAGVSITTISRVIHTPHLTSSKIQKTVNNIIFELGVKPDYIQKLRKNMHDKHFVDDKNLYQKILVIDNQVSESHINHGIEEQASKLGYKLIHIRFKNFNQHDEAQILDHILHQKIDGILVINDSPCVDMLKRYKQLLPPMILVNHFEVGLASIYFDHLSNGHKATNYLTNLGHQHIAILLGDKQSKETHLIKHGYMQALARKNIILNEEFIIYHHFDYDSGAEIINNLMNKKLKPTAIICCDKLSLNNGFKRKIQDEIDDNQHALNNSIYGIIDQCHKMKIKIPDDLSIFQFINHKNRSSNHYINQVCSIYKPAFEMGQQSIKALITLLNKDTKINNEPKPLTKLINTEVITRHSTQKNQHFRI